MSLAIDIIEKIYDRLSKSEVRKKYFSKQNFLNYDVNFLINSYKEESLISKYMPYSEAISWIPTAVTEKTPSSSIDIEFKDQIFKLDESTPNLTNFQYDALREFIRLGKTSHDHNEDIIRVNDIETKEDKSILHVQRCKYHDQVKSNLVLDWEGPHALQQHSGIATLRALVNSRYEPNKLPPLSTNLLANSLGISVVILYRDGENFVPYLPLRVGSKFKDLLKRTGRSPKNVAVHEGGYSTSASGAAQWNTGKTFYDFIMSDMFSEIDEEIGLYEADFDIIEPLAMVREFVRGGKPQIFFGAITKLSRDELNIRRSNAIAKTLELNFVPEIHDDVLETHSFDAIVEDIFTKGINLEALGNLNYIARFVDSYESGFYGTAIC